MTPQECRETEFAAAIARGPYLNHAGVAPTPARVARAVREAVEWSAADPLGHFVQQVLPAMDSARRRLAALMNVPAEHLALTKNTGHGLALVADAMVLEPGDNVVSIDCEYPCVVYPWYAQSYRGVETRLVAARPDGTFTADDVAAAMDGRTRAVCVSWVQFGTGFRVDLRSLAEAVHARGAVLIADVIQGIGALPLDAAALGLDVVATGVHKWLCAPGGTGGLYVAPALLPRLRLLNMGAGSVVNGMNFDARTFEPKPTVQRYEEGTPNILGLIGLDAALSMLQDVGIDAIARRVLELARVAGELLDRRGYEVTSPRDEARRSGLVMFRHREKSNDEVLDALTKANVAAAVRGGKVRFSPHVYNTEAEIEQAVAALPA